MFRSSFRSVLAIASACGLAAFASPAPISPLAAASPKANGAVVLLYHRFGEDSLPSTNIRLEQFEAQLAELASGPYRVLPLPQIVDALAAGRALPDHAVAISIDDAYLSVYQEAWPRLKAAGFPFTLFVATEPLDLGLPNYMSWDQLREMLDGGLVTFGQQSGAVGRTSDPFALPRFPLNETYGDLGRFRLIANALPLPVEAIVPPDPVLGPRDNPPAYGFTVLREAGDLDRLACFHLGDPLVWNRLVDRRIEVQVTRAFPQGRSRINCTLPGPNGRWRWLGHQFYVPKDKP